MRIDLPLNKRNYFSRNKPLEQCLLYSPALLPRPVHIQKPSVLVFSIDKEIRFLLKTALESWDYKVEEGETIEQAVLIAEINYVQLVLMDTGINFIESLIAMKRLKSYSQFQKTEFILMSGHAQEIIKQTAISSGAAVFLLKPIDLELLEKSLKVCFKIKETTNTEFTI